VVMHERSAMQLRSALPPVTVLEPPAARPAPTAPCGRVGAGAVEAPAAPDRARAVPVEVAPPAPPAPPAPRARPAEAVAPPHAAPAARPAPAVKQSKPVPPEPPAKPREPRPSDSPRAECGARTEFALYRCMQTECQQARWSKHAQCVRLRETDTVE
jgi:hypothetical protein